MDTDQAQLASPKFHPGQSQAEPNKGECSI